MNRKWIAFICVLGLLALPFTAYGELPSAADLLSGNLSEPVSCRLYSPHFELLSYMGENRLEDMNRLISHFSIRVETDAHSTGLLLYADHEPVTGIMETDITSDFSELYSAASNEPHADQTAVENQTYSAEMIDFLDGLFYPLNRLLDDLYPMFEKMPEAFAERAKESSANLNLSGFGKGIKRVTILFPADYVSESFPDSLSSLAETDESKQFLNALHYKGAQKILLLYDANDHIIRINYDGEAGLGQDNDRKVSLTWKCSRDSSGKKDDILLKTPAIKGNDRDNIIYRREAISDDDHRTDVTWDFKLDRKRGQDKQTVLYTAEWKEDSGTTDGNAVFTQRGDNKDYSISVKGNLNRENDDESFGTLEITTKTGKIDTCRMNTGIVLSSYKGFTEYETGFITSFRDEGGNGLDTPELQDGIMRSLIRKLILLPESDILFLNRDIPAETWNSLVDTLR